MFNVNENIPSFTLNVLIAKKLNNLELVFNITHGVRFTVNWSIFFHKEVGIIFRLHIGAVQCGSIFNLGNQFKEHREYMVAVTC